MIPLMVAAKPNEEENIKMLIRLLVEYRIALLCELKKNDYKNN